MQRCFPPAGPGVEGKFPAAQGRRIRGGEIFGLCPPAPHFARLPSQLKSEPQRPVFSHRHLEKAFIFQAPARPGKGVVLLFIGGEVSGEGKVLPYCTPTPGKSL